MLKAIAAVSRYERRLAREEQPEGYFDKARRWCPLGRDAQVLDAMREPGPAWSRSYLLICRSLEHCERYEGARHGDVLAVRRALRLAGVDSVNHPAAPHALRHLREATPLIQREPVAPQPLRSGPGSTVSRPRP